MVSDRAHGLIRDSFCIGGANAAPPVVLLGATRTAFGAKDVHAATFTKVVLQAAEFVCCCVFPPVPAEDDAGSGTEPVGLTLCFDVNRALRDTLRSSRNWRLSKGFCDRVLFDYVSFIRLP